MNKPATRWQLAISLMIVFSVMGMLHTSRESPTIQPVVTTLENGRDGEHRVSPVVKNTAPDVQALEQDPAVQDVERVVVLVYENGEFHPDRLDISVGTSVTFLNRSAVPVWPASNIHPTHAILPTFDPREPIAPGEAWVYTFDKAGYWRFHNHLEPSETGIVVALGNPSTARDKPAALTEIHELSFPPAPVGADERFDLHDETDLKEFVALYGPEAAIQAFYREQETTGVDCHTAAHHTGRVAYEVFGPSATTVTVHECQSGLQHGIIEALFSDRGTADLGADIAALCQVTNNQFVRHQCLHGIGHGLMAWTSYEIHDALALCDQAPPDDRPSCYSGVFMENVVGGLSGAMGHVSEYVNDYDPHYPCNVLAEQYVPDCYLYQPTQMLRVFDGDFARTAQACLETPDPRSQETCFIFTEPTLILPMGQTRRRSATTLPKGLREWVVSKERPRMASGTREKP